MTTRHTVTKRRKSAMLSTSSLPIPVLRSSLRTSSTKTAKRPIGVVTNAFFAASYPDIIRVSCTSGTFTASFTKAVAYNMYYCYGSAAVPAGWLVPLSYVNVGVPQNDDDEIAKVRLILPHSQGHTAATSNVSPYYYELTLQRET